ncbi:hypothetical protein [Salipiger sp. HF18]|uniref:hypothetical protein n=1 Tax=Salipiger sp. HF18 TaxID=2721557 RepID=UPI0034C6715B
MPEARAAFEQGTTLLWGFNHAAAVQAFRAAQQADPQCSACYWAEAYALGPNLNDGMHDENVTPAFDAAWTAVDTAVTDKEMALARALVLRYAFEGGNRELMNRAFAEAMGDVAAQFPDDANIQVFHADALMNMQPWDYWEADGVTPKGNGAEILASLERAMALSPEHPAALHLYIHAVEASADLARAEAAIAADETYLEAAGDAASALYRFGYYPHNIHFLLVGAQMAGIKEDALAAAQKLADVTSDEVGASLAWVQAIETAPYTAHAQFSTPEEILALPDPGDAFPFVKGHWHYARGIALALVGDLDGALAEQTAIERTIAEADLAGLEEQYLPARDVLEIAKHIVEARIAQCQGNWDSAEHHLEAAIEIEDTIAYMEPPYWYYPVRQTLGAVRLQAGDTQGAREAFEGALETQPNNAWALWGLWQVSLIDATGEAAVSEARTAFEKAWLGESEPDLGRI